MRGWCLMLGEWSLGKVRFKSISGAFWVWKHNGPSVIFKVANWSYWIIHLTVPQHYFKTKVDYTIEQQLCSNHFCSYLHYYKNHSDTITIIDSKHGGLGLQNQIATSDLNLDSYFLCWLLANYYIVNDTVCRLMIRHVKTIQFTILRTILIL